MPSSPDLPSSGRCRCGGVRVEITAPPLMTAACHCEGCQRMSGGAYSLTAMIPSAGFAVTRGAPVLGGLRGPHGQRHFFCPDCMSWMFTRIEGFDDRVNLRPTMLDDASWFTPFVETMTREKLPWATTPAVHSFEGFPPPERYQGLVDEFAARG